MRTLLLPLILLPLMPAEAEEPDIQCPGANTIEMRWCASKSWEESNQALKQQLSPETLETWKQATQEVCAVAYAPLPTRDYLSPDGCGVRRPTEPSSASRDEGSGRIRVEIE